MSSEKKIIYRREPIKKYKMHKVKKHWVVKGGVAGAMIVGSVGAPMVPHLAYAAETEEVDPGDSEEVKAKSLDEVQEETTTVESTTATPEATIATTEPAEETASSAEETEESDTTEAETKDSESSEKQSRVVENPDGTKTWTANEDAEFTVTNYKVLDSEGAILENLVMEDLNAENGVHFEATLNNSASAINVGDKLFIPTNASGIRGGLKDFVTINNLSIDGVGIANSVDDGIEIEITNDNLESKRFDFNAPGASGISRPAFQAVNGSYAGAKIVYTLAGMTQELTTKVTLQSLFIMDLLILTVH